MSNPKLDALAEQARATLAQQRSRVDTAKLLVTFSTAIAATLVASALQAGPIPSGWDFFASVVLAFAFLAAAYVVLLDRTKQIEVPAELTAATAASFEEFNRTLVRDTLAAVDNNRRKVQVLLAGAFVQFVLAGASSILAAVSLLFPPK